MGDCCTVNRQDAGKECSIPYIIGTAFAEGAVVVDTREDGVGYVVAVEVTARSNIVPNILWQTIAMVTHRVDGGIHNIGDCTA